jgi:psiF repeat-containing protein
MLRFLCVLGLLAAGLADAPVHAATKQQKLETCTFGADNQKLTGAARTSFMKKCMADEDRPSAPPASPSERK